MAIAAVLMRSLGASQRLRARAPLGYAIAVVGCGLAIAVRLWLGEVLVGFPYVTFFPVVVLTTFFGGVRPGLFSAVICGLAAWHFFMPPGVGFQLVWPSTYIALGFYALVVLVDIALISAMQQALLQLGAEQRTTARLLAEQRTLFRELQHRVANNLAFVAALLNLHKRELAAGDPAVAVLEDARARVFTMERIHRRLYDPARVELPVGPYLEELCRDILEASGSRSVTCRVEAPPLAFGFERLVLLSMLVSELVVNALKHAFADQRPGSILVRLAEADEGCLELSVRDDGRGLPAGFEPQAGDGLGLRIARGLAGQLGGAVEWRPAGEEGRGTLAVVRFPATAGDDRTMRA